MAITLDGNNVSTIGVINSATAKASTSGTSIDFTGIPSGVKRITVMFNGVSTNGTSDYLVQIGSGSVVASGYSSTSTLVGNGTVIAGTTVSTAGFMVCSASASNVYSGSMVLTLFSEMLGFQAMLLV